MECNNEFNLIGRNGTVCILILTINWADLELLGCCCFFSHKKIILFYPIECFFCIYSFVRFITQVVSNGEFELPYVVVVNYIYEHMSNIYFFFFIFVWLLPNFSYFFVFFLSVSVCFFFSTLFLVCQMCLIVRIKTKCLP